jgi:hypothetical protein
MRNPGKEFGSEAAFQERSSTQATASIVSLVLPNSPSMDLDIESLVHLEQSYAVDGQGRLFLTPDPRFYDGGYEDGFAHGRIHGLIEGRALGREKGYEMFEELGFYEGFASTWKTIYESTGRSEEFVCSSRVGFGPVLTPRFGPVEQSAT